MHRYTHIMASFLNKSLHVFRSSGPDIQAVSHYTFKNGLLPLLVGSVALSHEPANQISQQPYLEDIP